MDRYSEFKKINTSNIKKKKDTYITMPKQDMLMSYILLRRVLGILGITLPIILFLLTAFKGANLQPSISAYYHTCLSLVFTGTLIIIAVFLFTYVGENNKEKLTCRVAAVSALGVALFPTGNDCNFIIKSDQTYSKPFFENFIIPSIEKPLYFEYCHYFFAILFFLALAFLVLNIFVQEEILGENKKQRKIIYIFCGWGMIISIALIGLTKFLIYKKIFTDFSTTFILESIALWCFGIAWLVKGEIIEAVERKLESG